MTKCQQGASMLSGAVAAEYQLTNEVKVYTLHPVVTMGRYLSCLAEALFIFFSSLLVTCEWP